MTLLRVPAGVLALVAAMLLSGCPARGDPDQPIPTVRIAPPVASERPPLVVVLPGIRDGLDDLRRSGIAAAVQAQWPQAEVLLAGAAIDYYRAGMLEQRLHAGIVGPAVAAGREVWLLGASLGGMGALLYERAHPGRATGLVLLAPWLGDTALIDEIHAAGGLADWQPGPAPATVGPGEIDRELWRFLRQRLVARGEPARLWLGYGDDDALAPAYRSLLPHLPSCQVVVAEGGHRWSVWVPVAARILERIDARCHRSLPGAACADRSCISRSDGGARPSGSGPARP